MLQVLTFVHAQASRQRILLVQPVQRPMQQKIFFGPFCGGAIPNGNRSWQHGKVYSIQTNATDNSFLVVNLLKKKSTFARGEREGGRESRKGTKKGGKRRRHTTGKWISPLGELAKPYHEDHDATSKKRQNENTVWTSDDNERVDKMNTMCRGGLEIGRPRHRQHGKRKVDGMNFWADLIGDTTTMTIPTKSVSADSRHNDDLRELLTE